jgi:hypothetical protein
MSISSGLACLGGLRDAGAMPGQMDLGAGLAQQSRKF